MISYIERNRGAVVEFLRKLVAFPSVTGEEGEIQLFLSRKLEEMCLSVDVWEPDMELINGHPAALPVEEEKGLNSIVSGHFGHVPLFAMIILENDEVKELCFIENPYAKAEKKRGIRAAQLLIENKVNIAIVGEIGESPINILENNFIQVERIPPEKKGSTLSEIIEMFITKQKDKA